MESIETVSLSAELKDKIASSANSEKTTQKILFVDDDADDLLFFETAMKGMNILYDLHYAASGDELFNLLEQVTPDLIFLDLHLPGKSGITCLKMLRYHKKYDTIPIIIYSRFNNPAFIDDCFNAKANYYIVKPVTIDKISKVLSKVIAMNWDVERYPLRENFLIE